MSGTEYLKLKTNLQTNLFAIFNLYTNLRANKDITQKECQVILTHKGRYIVDFILDYLDKHFNIMNVYELKTNTKLYSYINE